MSNSSHVSLNSDSDIDSLVSMVERTLRELVAPDVNIQTLCTQYLELDI